MLHSAYARTFVLCQRMAHTLQGLHGHLCPALAVAVVYTTGVRRRREREGERESEGKVESRGKEAVEEKGR